MEYHHFSSPRGHYYTEPEHQQQHDRHPSSLPPYPYPYGGYAHTSRKMVFQPVIPHDNDILMGRGGKNNQHCGNEKLRQVRLVTIMGMLLVYTYKTMHTST